MFGLHSCPHFGIVTGQRSASICAGRSRCVGWQSYAREELSFSALKPSKNATAAISDHPSELKSGRSLAEQFPAIQHPIGNANKGSCFLSVQQIVAGYRRAGWFLGRRGRKTQKSNVFRLPICFIKRLHLSGPPSLLDANGPLWEGPTAFAINDRPPWRFSKFCQLTVIVKQYLKIIRIDLNNRWYHYRVRVIIAAPASAA